MLINDDAMKHIYIFSNQCTAENYGVGTYIQQLLSFIKKENVFLSVVILQSDKIEFSIFKDDKQGIRYIYIPKCVGGNFIEDPNRAIEYYKVILYLLIPHISIKDENIFHFQYTNVISFVQLLKERYMNSKIIVTLHYMEWAFILKGNTTWFRTIIQQSPNKVLIQEENIVYLSYVRSKQLFLSVEKTICLSQYAYNLLQNDFQIPSDKLIFIPNGLAEKENYIQDQENHSIKTNEEEKIILFVGRLDENKGLHYLLAAFRRLTNVYPSTHLIIVGDGDYNTFLGECIGLWNRISFTGKVSKSILYSLYKIATVGVLPSLNEQCSYVAIEMMKHGIPIVGTDSTGLSEMIMNDINGYKVPIINNSIDIGMLADKLLVCFNNEKRMILSKGALSLYHQKYTIEEMRKEYHNLYAVL